MNDGREEKVREVLRSALHAIAPEIRLEDLDPGADLREEADLDSVDFMNLVVAIHQDLGVEIPESDYGELSTLDKMVGYLARRPPPG